MPAKKAPTKKTPKKSVSKKPAGKKTAAKKTVSKKSVTKKAPSKKTAAKQKPAKKKAVAKKPAKKKATAKKSAPKKAAVKKSAPKKSAAKKTPTKKASTGKVSAKKAPKEKETRRSRVAGSPELDQVSCQLASLAIAQEENPLSVRQREQLRRALAAAGEELGWIEPTGNSASVAEFSTDLIAMAKNGAKSLGVDLAEDLANKKTEVARLNKVIEYARELAEDPNTVYPVDIVFVHTIRDAYQEYVTKTETRVANDADEARSAAAAIERSLTSWTKLADAMILDLKRRQKQLSHVTEGLPEFVESSHDLLGAVVANLW